MPGKVAWIVSLTNPVGNRYNVRSSMNRVYALAKRKDAIGANAGASEPYWLEVLAVGKRNHPLKYTVANEYIAARIGDFLGLPIPPYGLLQMKGTYPEVWFSSLDYRLTG